MNILIVVMTMLMLMAILTYSRLESYRSFSVLKREFIHYMQSTEREAINAQAVKLYEITTASEIVSQKKTKTDAVSRIPISVLINKAERDAHPKEFPLIRELTKNLMHYLYHEAPFYKQLEETRPGFVDDLLNALMQAADNLPEGKKITQLTDLSNLELGDEQLDTAFYHMIKGNKLTDAEIGPEPEEEKIQLQSLLERKEGEEPEDADAEELAFRSPQGYYSLYDYITLTKSTKIRVFLAPYPILMVLFNEDPGTVQAIIDQRQTLYSQVNSKAQTADFNAASASAEFKRFVHSKAPPHWLEIMDTTVTKTNPKNYE